MRTDMTKAVGAFRDCASESRGRLLKLKVLRVFDVFHVSTAVVLFEKKTKYSLYNNAENIETGSGNPAVFLFGVYRGLLTWG